MFFFNFSGAFVFLVLGGCAPISSTKSQPTFNYAVCSDPPDKTSSPSYESNRGFLLDSLSTKASQNYSFYNDTYHGIHGLFLCRGDVDNSTCQRCVSYASRDITSRCSSNRSAIIWFDECMFRYSNSSFFGHLQIYPSFLQWNINNRTSPDVPNYGARSLINSLIGEALATKMFFSARNESSPGNRSEFIYGLVQCTRDLNADSCSSCLNQLMTGADDCCQKQKGWRLSAPSCNIRYESYPFFQQSPPEPVPTPPEPVPTPPQPLPAGARPLPGRKVKHAVKIIIITVSSIAVIGALMGLWYRSPFGCRKRQEGRMIRLGNLKLLPSIHLKGRNAEDRDQHNFEEIQSFHLRTLQTATNNFSDENKLGEGGFGPVYKGNLICGKEIAVKKLSMKSGQSMKEFKNEMMVIGRLQHRNLVRLLGYCSKADEKLLVYEYMANTSLDAFLFDRTKSGQLDWATRLSIISGIARGLLYLHEDSRLKIIHRDLKASNILLDDDMNPKISDFGTAKIFDSNQKEANTNRIIGTYGYMAPEYAMYGEYSIKSDVYSFGVLVLEIVSGQRNVSRQKNNCFRGGEIGEDLLSYAWKNWRQGTASNIVDPTLGLDLTSEIMRCVQIGLLCVQDNVADRPTMASVVLMLSSYSVTIPVPSQPARLMPTSIDLKAAFPWEHNLWATD